MAVELTYFDMSGLGEPVRVMLSYGGIPFIDKRISKEDWSSLKPTTKFGQLPRLRIDGLELYQSRAICRYIAGKLKLRGKTEKSAALADMWVDLLDDVRMMIIQWYYRPDSEERTKKMESLKKVELPAVLSKLENILEKDGSQFLVENELSWADVMLFAYFTFFAELLHTTASDLLSTHSRLQGIFSTIHKSPGIQKYLETRPASPPDMRVMFT